MSLDVQLSARDWLLGAALVACGVVYSPVGTGFARFMLPKEIGLHLLVVALVVNVLLGKGWRGTDHVDRAVAWAVVALALSSWSVTNWALALRQGGLTLGYALVFVTLRERPSVARYAALALALLLAASALGEALGWWALSATGFAPGGFTGQRNHMAHGAALALAAVLGSASPSPLRRVSAYLAVALLAAAIVVTRSRAAYLASGLAVVCALPLVVRRENVSRGAIVTAIAAALIAPSFATALHWTAAHPYRDSLVRVTDRTQGSGAFRLEEARATLHQLVAKPLHAVLGFGPGQWSLHYLNAAPSSAITRARADGSVIRLAHNDLLARGAEGGVVGLIAAVACALAFGRALREQQRLLRVAPFAVAFLVVEGFDAGISIPSTGLIATLLLAAHLPRGDDTGRSRVMPWAVLVPGFASLAALVVLVRAARADLTFVREDAPALLALACVEDPTATAHCADAIRRALVVRDCASARMAVNALAGAYPMYTLLPALREQAIACSP